MKKKTKRTYISQLIVAVPRWLQKRMLKNLQLAARCKVSPVRAQRASEILKALHADSKPCTEPISKSLAGIANPIPEVNFGWTSRIRRFVSYIFSKARFCFFKAKALFHLRANKVINVNPL